MGEIAMDGYDGYISVCQSPFVAALRGVVADEFTGEPPVGSALRVDSFLETVVPAGIGFVTDADTEDFFFRQAWNVDVECDAGMEPVIEGGADDLSDKG